MRQFYHRYGFLVVLLLAYLVYAATLIPITTDDIRLADVFSVDESGAAAELRHFYTTGRLDRASFKYGSLFYYVPLLAVSLYGWVAPVTDQVILIAFRSFGTVAGAGCIILTFLLGRRLYDAKAGAVASLLICSPVFLRWSVETHPDLPQLICVCAFLWRVVAFAEKADVRSVVVAAAFAGLAFNMKYVGVFLMPVLVASIFLQGTEEQVVWEPRRLLDSDKWKQVGLAALAFIVVVGVTNPYAILKYDAFARSLQAESKIMSFGHTFRMSGGAVAWGRQLGGVLGWPHIAVLVAVAIWHGVRRHRPRTIVVVYLIWLVGYVLYLSIFSQLIRPRHVLPVIPVLAILCGGAYRLAWDKLRDLSPFPAAQYAVLAVFLFGVGRSLPTVAKIATIRLDRQDGQDEIQAGRWLAEHYDADQSVLYDSYSYVPGKFQQVARTFGMTYLAIEHFRPNLLLVRDAIVSDYADTSKAKQSRIGRVAHLDSHYFYRYLKEERLSEYRRVKTYPTMSIYERTDALTSRPVKWTRLMAMFGSGKALGVSKARLRMSDAHLIAGNHEIASEQRALAHKAQNHALSRFNSAKALLGEGNLIDARRAFDEVLAMVAARPDSYRAAIHQHVSRTLFEAGYYNEAVAESRLAIDLHDPLHDAHFELGIFLLASGDITASDSVLSRSVARFGKSDHARNLLEQLTMNDIAPEAARRAVHTHFSR